MLPFREEARKIRADMEAGVSATQEPADLVGVDVRKLGREDATDVLNAVRPRLFACSSAMIGMVFDSLDDYRATLPPYKLEDRITIRRGEKVTRYSTTKPIKEIETFRQLGRAYFETTKNAQTRLFGELRSQQPSFVSWYDELDRLLEYFRRDKKTRSGNFENPDIFIQAGIGTATQVCERTLSLVLQAHQEHAPDASAEEMHKTAMLAKGIPNKIAYILQLETIDKGLASLGGVHWDFARGWATSFDHDRFSVRPDDTNPNVLTIGLDDAALSDPGNPGQHVNGLETRFAKLGCPALVATGVSATSAPNPISELYTKTVETAGQADLWHKAPSLPKVKIAGFLI
jgi:hypothetical protein